VSFQSQPRFFASAAIAAPCFWPTSKAAMPRYGTSSMKLPLASTKRSSTAITFKPLALALATMAGPRDTSGGQITKPLAPLAARVSIAERVFSPSGTAILITVKPWSLPAFSAKAHSVWNQGSSACLTRKPIFTSSADAKPLKAIASARVPSVFLNMNHLLLDLVVVHHRTPAIDHQAGCIDKRRLVSRQEQRRHRHFYRLADTLGRVQIEGALTLGVRVRKTVPVIDIELSFDIPRGDGIHADALGRVFDAQGASEPEQAVLGDGIGKAAGDDVAGVGG